MNINDFEQALKEHEDDTLSIFYDVLDMIGEDWYIDIISNSDILEDTDIFHGSDDFNYYIAELIRDGMEFTSALECLSDDFNTYAEYFICDGGYYYSTDDIREWSSKYLDDIVNEINDYWKDKWCLSYGLRDAILALDSSEFYEYYNMKYGE